MIAYDCEYGKIPLEDGSSVYVLTDLLPESFTPYCPEANIHGCKSCGWNCTSCTETQLCAYPTVLIIDSPVETRNYEMKTSLDELFRYSLQVSLILIGTERAISCDDASYTVYEVLDDKTYNPLTVEPIPQSETEGADAEDRIVIGANLIQALHS